MTANAKHVRDYRARAKELGLVRIELYVPEHHRAELKRLEAQWRKEAAKNENGDKQ